MEYDPELEGPGREREREAPQPERARPQMWRPELEPQSEPAQLQPQLQPQPELSPQLEPQLRIPAQLARNKPDPLTALLLIGLMIFGGIFWMGRDVKHDPPPEPLPASVETVANQIVVDLVDDITPKQIAGLEQTFNIRLRFNSKFSEKSKLMVADVPPGMRDLILQGLRKSKLVEAADPNIIRYSYAKTFVPNDPAYGTQWHMKMIGMEEAWTYTKGKGAVVAIVDTGFGLADPSGLKRPQDFADTTLKDGYDFVEKDDVPQDEVGHGTHVAGTIAESTNNGIMGAGVAPEATLMIVRVLGPRGGSDADVADGIRYAADHGANVMNLSLGGPGASTVLQLAVQYAHKKGVALLCAAGNDGKEAIGYPAKFKECVVVSAVGPTQNIAPYSNFGDEVDLAGPGGDTQTRRSKADGVWQNTVQLQRSTGFFAAPKWVEGFFELEGTSMATPHVSGVAALLVSLGVTDPDEIRSILRKTATAAGPPKQYGAGILNAAAAVKSTGRDPNQQMYGYAALAVGAFLIYFLVESGQAVSAIITLVVGYFIPIGIEKWAGFGSPYNLIGHSVAIPVIWLLTPNMQPSRLRQAAALTFGMAIHFLLDLYCGASPFQVHPQTRIALWFYLNLAIAAYLIVSALFRAGAKPRKKKRRKGKQPRPAYAS